MKINVVGTSASGKTTFANAIARALDLPCIEMDALFWGPNWTQTPDDVFLARLQAQLRAPCWVLDGNYTRTIAIKWRHVDIVVWLDYSFARTLSQSISRALRRLASGRELWPNTGNRESLARLLSRDSIVWWCVKGYFKNRQKYQRAMSDPQYEHIQFVRLRTPRQAGAWLESLSGRAG